MSLLSEEANLSVPTYDEKQGCQAGILEPHVPTREAFRGHQGSHAHLRHPGQHLGVVSKTKEHAVSFTVSNRG